MAEGDRFERAFGAGWLGAYRLARNGAAPPAEVADKLVTALAKKLRDRGGVPGFGEMVETVDNAAWRLTLQPSGLGEGDAVLIESFDALDRIVRDEAGHRHTKVAVDVAKSLLVRQGAPTNGHGIWPMTTHLAEDTCNALVENYFFATARQNLVAEGKVKDHKSAMHWQNSVEGVMRPALQQIAEKVAKDPHCEALRAPNRTVKSQSTSDLLGERLLGEELVILVLKGADGLAGAG